MTQVFLRTRYLCQRLVHERRRLGRQLPGWLLLHQDGVQRGLLQHHVKGRIGEGQAADVHLVPRHAGTVAVPGAHRRHADRWVVHVGDGVVAGAVHVPTQTAVPTTCSKTDRRRETTDTVRCRKDVRRWTPRTVNKCHVAAVAEVSSSRKLMSASVRFASVEKENGKYYLIDSQHYFRKTRLGEIKVRSFEEYFLKLYLKTFYSTAYFYCLNILTVMSWGWSLDMIRVCVGLFFIHSSLTTSLVLNAAAISINESLLEILFWLCHLIVFPSRLVFPFNQCLMDFYSSSWLSYFPECHKVLVVVSVVNIYHDTFHWCTGTGLMRMSSSLKLMLAYDEFHTWTCDGFSAR